MPSPSTTAGARLLTAAALLLLSGCAANGVEERRVQGLPDGVEWNDVIDRPVVLRDDGPGRVLFVAYGSGSCPVLVHDVTWEDDDHVVLTARRTVPRLSACTSDLTPTTSVLDLSAHDDDGPLTVEVEFPGYPDMDFTTELPAAD